MKKRAIRNNLKILIVISAFIFSFFQIKAQTTTLSSTGCNNADFEYGTFTNWVGYTGTYPGGAPNMTATGIVNGRHTIMGPTNPGTDPESCGGITYVSNLAGGPIYSCRLGNSLTGAQAERLEYTFVVSNANALFYYQYAVLLEDPGHGASEQPKFEITVVDAAQNQLGGACGVYLVVASASIPGFSNCGGSYGTMYKPWSLVGVDLSAYIGQTVTIRFTTCDCSQTGHYGYAYIEAGCATMLITLDYCVGSSIASVTAPPGFTYSWTGPGITTPVTTQVLNLTNFTPGSTYYCVCTSVSGCSITLSTVVSPTVVTAAFTDTIICKYVSFYDQSTATNNNTVTTWLWDFGDGTTSTLQDPTHLYSAVGTYNVTLIATTSGGCTDTINHVITVTQTSSTFTGIATASPVSICIGDSSVIDMPGPSGTSYIWSSSPFDPSLTSQNTSNPVTVYPTATTAYMVTATELTHQCLASDTATVVVNPMPTPVISGPVSVCTGSTHLYSTPSVPGHTYSWVVTGGTPTTGNADNITVTWGTAGPGTLTLTETSSAACIVTTPVYNVTINSSPNATVTSNSPICDGSTLLLTGGGGTGYLWSGPNGFTSTAQYPMISGASVAASGTYTVLVTSSNGCILSTSTQVTVNPLPTPLAGSNSPICSGDTLFLNTGGVSGTNTYSWSGPNGYSSTDQNPFFALTTNVNTGLYTVAVTDANGCIMTSPTNVIVNTINPNIGNNTPICSGNNLNINANGGVIYNWSGPNGYTSSQSNIIISQATTSDMGLYTVTITDANGCIGQLYTYAIVNPLPVPVATNNSPICSGEDIKLNCGGGSSYAWSGPLNFISTEQNPVIYSANISGTGIYNVTVTDLNGCSSATSTNVIVNPLPVVTVSNNTPVCSGETVNITCSTGTGFAWNCAENGYTSTSQNPTIAASTVLTSGNYTVTVTTNGCTSTGTTTVVVNPLPAPTATSNSPLCYGDRLELIATGGATYAWSSTNGFTSSLPMPVINIATDALSGIYSVTVTDANGCSSTAITSVSVASKITVQTIDMTICSGTSVNISAYVIGGTAPYSYYWDGYLSQSQVLVTPITDISYEAQVLDANGCKSNVSTLHIDVLPPVKVNAYATNDTVCPGESVKIYVTASDGDGGPYSLYLSDGTIISSPYTAYPDGVHEFIIMAKDGCGSIDSDTIRIRVFEIPPMSYSPDKTSGCVPLEVWFNETSQNAGQTYLWDFGDNSYNSNSYTQNPSHIFENAGTYDVRLTITSKDGCKTIYTYTDLITAYPRPEAAFYPDNDLVSIINPIINFENASSNAIKYYWTFGDGDSSDLFNASHYYNNIGTFIVRLVVETVYGCTDTTYYTVYVQDEFTLFAPTAFTPDNDGTNDIFFVQGNGIDTNSFNMIIYDRWGEKIYETNNYSYDNPKKYGWDGTVKGSSKIGEIGIYTWVVIYKDNNQIEHQETGVVTLIK